MVFSSAPTRSLSIPRHPGPLPGTTALRVTRAKAFRTFRTGAGAVCAACGQLSQTQPRGPASTGRSETRPRFGVVSQIPHATTKCESFCGSRRAAPNRASQRVSSVKRGGRGSAPPRPALLSEIGCAAGPGRGRRNPADLVLQSGPVFDFAVDPSVQAAVLPVSSRRGRTTMTNFCCGPCTCPGVAEEHGGAP